jgi:membrane-associated phospholipid phosphatase
MLFRGRRSKVAGRRKAESHLRPATRDLRTHKLALSITLSLYLCILYFGLERIVFFVPHQFELSRVDELIRFDPGWTFVYQSLYLLLPLPWLASSRDQLRRYTHGFFIVTAISFIFFFAFPVEGPRPDVMTRDPFYQLLMRYDRNLNAFPSLHAALAVYTFLFALRILPRRRALIGVIGGAWVALILFATMATKQHYAVDVVGGVLVAVCADLLAWRYTPRIEAAEVSP